MSVAYVEVVENEVGKEKSSEGVRGGVEKLVIEYLHKEFPLGREHNIRIYENGRIEYALKSPFRVDDHIKKELNVEPEEVVSYADELLNLGFLFLTKNYGWPSSIGSGDYFITLNYKDVRKTVRFKGLFPNRGYWEFIHKLEELVR